MENYPKKTPGTITIATIAITYVIVKIVSKLIGFHYDISEGIFNIRFLSDLALWVIVFYLVNYLLRKFAQK